MFNAETLKYDTNGLLPVIAQCAETREVLMLAWMNAESVSETLSSRRVTYWSR